MSGDTDNTAPEVDAPSFEHLTLNTVEVDKRFRALNGADGERDLRVVWMGDHTLDPLMRATLVTADSFGVSMAAKAAPFGQHFQELLDEASHTRTESPDAIVLSLTLRQLAPELVLGQGTLDGDAIEDGIARALDTVAQWVALALENTSAHLIVCNFIRPPSTRFGPADHALSMGEQAIYARLNLGLNERLSEDPRVSVVDANHAAATAGLAAGWNPRMYHLAKIEWNTAVYLHIARAIARVCRALVVPAKKCLVVDLDNTMWGGVLGEDGPTGIRIGQGDPVGESFAAFQSALLDLKARGVVLAVCSKNNHADVEEAFSIRKDMPVSLDDFAFTAINWQPKHENIKAIAEALNIGVDSLAFIDDNPVECALVRQMLPEVLTVQVPEDPSELADLVYRLPVFDKLRMSAEDAAKTRQYADNFKREALRESVTDMSSFLATLETEVDIASAQAGDRTRIHQLFTKTNQFNVTTIRYTQGDIDTMLSDGNTHLHTIRARDKFGDLGMIGIYLLRQTDDTVAVDSFVMSCRALGRGIEAAAANTLKQFAFETLGATSITARFIPTAKNKPAEDFFQKQGFETTGTEDTATHFVLFREASAPKPSAGITVTVEVTEP